MKGFRWGVTAIWGIALLAWPGLSMLAKAMEVPFREGSPLSFTGNDWMYAVGALCFIIGLPLATFMTGVYLLVKRETGRVLTYRKHRGTLTGSLAVVLATGVMVWVTSVGYWLFAPYLGS